MLVQTHGKENFNRMSKFNQEWLEQYRRNPRESNGIYKNYSNPMGVDANYTANNLGPNPLVRSMFNQEVTRGTAEGTNQGMGELQSLIKQLPPYMQGYNNDQILAEFNRTRQANQEPQPKLQQTQQQVQTMVQPKLQPTSRQDQTMLEAQFQQLHNNLVNYNKSLSQGHGPGQQNPFFKGLIEGTGSARGAIRLINYFTKKQNLR